MFKKQCENINARKWKGVGAWLKISAETHRLLLSLIFLSPQLRFNRTLRYFSLPPPLQLRLLQQHLCSSKIQQQRDMDLEPIIGMEFDSIEKAKKAYMQYAYLFGFACRAETFVRSKSSNQIISYTFVCSKWGIRQNKRTSIRTGCTAMLMIKTTDSKKWVVSNFEKIHNHELYPSPPPTHPPPLTHVASFPYKLRSSSRNLSPHFTHVASSPYKLRSSSKNLFIRSKQSNVGASSGSLDMELYIGRSFDSKEIALSFYKYYAVRKGFTVRIGRNRKSKKDLEVISWEFVCSRAGFSSKKLIGKEPYRIGCKALVRIAKKGQEWVLATIEESHNHDLEISAEDHY